MDDNQQLAALWAMPSGCGQFRSGQSSTRRRPQQRGRWNVARARPERRCQSSANTMITCWRTEHH